jgi:ubiquinone/menaquinone biosynthesis C-methylase UbiE
MTNVQRSYLPAAGRDWMLPLYDPLVKLLGGDKTRKALLEQAAVRRGDRVLDIGCGTGTLAAVIKRLHPGIEVVGLDPDPRALARARRKAQQAEIGVQFDQGFSDSLPYAAASFDRVFSSFMFHHLPEGERGNTLREIRRVLKPGASLHMVDFAGPGSRPHGWLARMLHSSERLKDNSEDRILTLLKQAGFSHATKVMRGTMLFGRLNVNYFQASVPFAGSS